MKGYPRSDAERLASNLRKSRSAIAWRAQRRMHKSRADVKYPRNLRISAQAPVLARCLYESRMMIQNAESGTLYTLFEDLPKHLRRGYEEIAIRLLMGLTQPEDTHRAEDFLWDYATTIARSQNLRMVPR